MKEIFYSITNDVFTPFPDYVRGVVVARGVKNGPSPAELTALLREAEEQLRGAFGSGDVAAHPRIASWRERSVRRA